MKRKRIDIITLGCSKNLVDSEQLMRQLEEVGYSVTHDTENPQGEIAVINTCGFIGDAKEESINMILEFAERKEEGDLKKLFVMGCLSERYLKELAVEIPQVDKFYGKFNWKELLQDLGKVYHDELYIERTLTTPQHYAYLKISEGCDRKCSYCAIPIITGRHISKPMEEILDEVRYLVSQGVKEFQAICVVGGKAGVLTEYAAPCGVCRQVMREFCAPDDFKIYLAKSPEDYREFTLEQILPMGFGPENLEVK